MTIQASNIPLMLKDPNVPVRTWGEHDTRTPLRRQPCGWRHNRKEHWRPRASPKNPQVPHTSRKVVSSLNNLRCKRSSIPPQNTRPDTPEQTQQGPCNLSQIRLQEVRSRTLRFLPQLEMRLSSIAPNPEESREASPKSTVSLISQRHPEKLPEATGTSQGNPGFPAATLERHRN